MDFVKKLLPLRRCLYDIDLSPFLFPRNLPTNVTFIAPSITELPNAWTSSFSLVDQRLFLGGLAAATRLQLSPGVRILRQLN